MNHKSLAKNSKAIIQVGLIDSIAKLFYSSSKDNTILNDIEAMVDNSKKIISEILGNHLEFGFITGQGSNLPGTLVVRKLNNEEFVFVKKASLVSVEPIVSINDWLCFNRASTSYHHFTKEFKNLGLKVLPIFYSTSLGLLKEMAIAGQGTALLPLHFVQEELIVGN